MACITVEHLSFTYPDRSRAALRDVSFSVEEGEFLTVLGPSGGGKSTLLRCLKPALTPHGLLEGEILFCGRQLSAAEPRQQAAEIGFVLQDPEHQLVTDKVWHELAFGLESLGMQTSVIRRRVAEMAAFFGIEDWFYRDVSTLSGGQKQLLNLASVMAMQPKLLLLDEPTSQLDPIAASEFLSAVARLRRELGITVILSEHRLEEAIPLSDRVLALDGSVLTWGSAAEVSRQLFERRSPVYASMPTPIRVSTAVSSAACPVTVTEGRQWLTEFAKTQQLLPVPPRTLRPAGEQVLSVKDVYFRYEKNGPEVLRGLNCEVAKGQMTALLGGNGSGKTTVLSLLAGLQKPQRGRMTCRAKRIGLLPQDPRMLFVRATVREELGELLTGEADREQRIADMAALCKLDALLDAHPYDLSGGEQQRAALAKLLLSAPEVLLLDEPTKGMDAQSKRELAVILRKLLSGGATVVMVSHDVEFCAEYADRCLLLFDGGIAAEGNPTEFFSGNSFYTTAANRMARQLLLNAVTCGELIAACGGKETDFPADDGTAAAVVQSAPHLVKALPLWRILLSCVCLAFGVLLFLEIVTPLHFTFLSGLSEGLQCVLLAVFVLLTLLLVSRKSDRTLPKPQKKRLTLRTWVALGILLLAIPATVLCGVYLLEDRRYLFISLLVLMEAMLPFALLFERRGPSARELTLLAVLAALAVAGRAAFYALPQFKPVIALVVISGVSLGGESGFLVGALSMLLSNMIFGQGPWTPWQMFAMGSIGFTAGVLYRRGILRRDRVSLCVFGAASALLLYGGIMNPASAILWHGELTWKTVAVYCVSGFPMDAVQALATVCYLWLFGEPMLEKLDRIRLKYGLL